MLQHVTSKHGMCWVVVCIVKSFTLHHVMIVLIGAVCVILSVLGLSVVVAVAMAVAAAAVAAAVAGAGVIAGAGAVIA